MLTIIKTGIVTIILSFISGVLLDYYKNLAPRIVCNISDGKSVDKQDKKRKLYYLTVKNISKKTIHDLNLNLHAQCESLKIEDAKITKGLKFDVENEENIYDISIPFLSKNDEFSVKIYLEDSEKISCDPSAVLRSPESFKRINSGKNAAKDFSDESKESRSDKRKKKKKTNIKLLKNKKTVMTAAVVLALICIGIFSIKLINKNSEKLGGNHEASDVIDSGENTENSNNKSEAEPAKKATASGKSNNDAANKSANKKSNDTKEKTQSSEENNTKKTAEESKSKVDNEKQNNEKSSSASGKSNTDTGGSSAKSSTEKNTASENK